MAQVNLKSTGQRVSQNMMNNTYTPSRSCNRLMGTIITLICLGWSLGDPEVAISSTPGPTFELVC
jgi:hypothetical protein